jgi:hypothetical protein
VSGIRERAASRREPSDGRIPEWMEIAARDDDRELSDDDLDAVLGGLARAWIGIDDAGTSARDD